MGNVSSKRHLARSFLLGFAMLFFTSSCLTPRPADEPQRDRDATVGVQLTDAGRKVGTIGESEQIEKCSIVKNLIPDVGRLCRQYGETRAIEEFVIEARNQAAAAHATHVYSKKLDGFLAGDFCQSRFIPLVLLNCPDEVKTMVLPRRVHYESWNTPVDSGSPSGPKCVKGCPCGNACIPCWKKCHKY